MISLLVLLIGAATIPSSHSFSAATVCATQADPDTASCQSLLDAFSTATGNFTTCVFVHTKPVCFCESCVSHYRRLDAAYEKIKNASECNDDLLHGDLVGVVNEVYKFGVNLWKKAQCEDCHNTKRAPLVKQFFALEYEFEDCWLNKSLESLVATSPPTNSSRCSTCYKKFSNLNSFYNDHFGSNPAKVCADVAGHMNSTLRRWSTKCSEINKQTLVIAIICSVVLSLPLVFYVTTYLFHVKDQRQYRSGQKGRANHASPPPASPNPRGQTPASEQLKSANEDLTEAEFSTSI
ncbi:osteopetrosis-associated transmembrane protein 1-like isoform X2 [Oscarella lobularis]